MSLDLLGKQLISLDGYNRCKAAINSLNSLFGCVGNWQVGLWIDAYEISGEALPFFSCDHVG
jgi:hypothetical protein